MDEERNALVCDPNLTFKHDYPATKLMFIPDKEGTRPDLLATTGEFLRIWHVGDDGVTLERLLNNVRAHMPTCRDHGLHGCAAWRQRLHAWQTFLPSLEIP